MSDCAVGAKSHASVVLELVLTPTCANTLALVTVNDQQWWRYAQDAPVLIRRALADVMAGRILVFSALGLKLIGVMVLFVLYLLSPLDIVPEAAFGIAGYIDDLAIACTSTLQTSFPRLLVCLAHTHMPTNSPLLSSLVSVFVLAYCATIYRAFIIANAQQHAQQAAAGAAAAT